MKNSTDYRKFISLNQKVCFKSGVLVFALCKPTCVTCVSKMEESYIVAVNTVLYNRIIDVFFFKNHFLCDHSLIIINLLTDVHMMLQWQFE